jgi:hypothetical protein
MVNFIIRLHIIFSVVQIVGLQSYAQTTGNDTLVKEGKGKYIEKITDLITLKLTLNNDIEKLAVYTDASDIKLSPNTKTIARLSFNYKFISISLSLAPKFFPGNDDDDIRGKSKIGGFGFNFNFTHWLQELSYSRTKGYYLENTKDFIPLWKDGDPYAQIPDLLFKNFQGVTAYNFNPRFSVNALATQSERQLRSAGSFIPHLLYRYYIVDNRTPRTATSTTQKSKNFEMVLGAGYYYNFVIRNSFYIALGVTPGIGYNFTTLQTRFPSGTEKTKSNSALFRIDARAATGYNGHRFFSGLNLNASAAKFRQQNTTAINEDTRLFVQLFAGYRLNAPGFLREKVESVNKVIGL